MLSRPCIASSFLVLLALVRISQPIFFCLTGALANAGMKSMMQLAFLGLVLLVSGCADVTVAMGAGGPGGASGTGGVGGTGGTGGEELITLGIVGVVGSDLTCIFDNDCSVGVSDTSGDLLLVGASGTGFLQSRSFARGETGSTGEGLYPIQYRIDMRQLVGTPCLVSLSLDSGPISPLDYDADTLLDDLWVVTAEALGTVAPTTATLVGDRLTLEFAPGVCAGSTAGNGDSSFFFGFASEFAPHDTQAELEDDSGRTYAVDARAPAFGP